MTDQIEWSLGMSDEDFVEASKPLFQKKFLNLHEACCLLAKEDPAKREAEGRIVGEGFWEQESTYSDDYDQTSRPFRAALEAIKTKATDERPWQIPLTALEVPTKIQNGKDVLINTRTFMKWAIEQFEGQVGWIVAAERAYEERRKKNSPSFLINKPEAVSKEISRRNAFKQMMNELGKKAGKLSDRELGWKLAARIKEEDFHAKSETLRKKIAIWRKQLKTG
ncbi:hypothetical protein RXV86_09750 [Alisedimentitalea sp. MJ-SS2]|uniref:hypothetical protein n=1 Tax=Aliisedimentitalea sp. MJ-SS2 TaxID=3049795 RepID=UPI00290E978D|nr:hypothetical protein [Alisedimentitalea sp. MJ-SS2]MDU8927667.1 hypothetical protein [Alisedimentitalea sp. MJ-SS2]